MGPYGSQNVKTLLLPQISFESLFFELFLNILLFSVVLKKVLFWIFEILSFRYFNEFFKFTIVPYGETINLNLSVKRVTVERNGVKFGPHG